MTTSVSDPPDLDLLDEGRLRSLSHGLGGPAEVDGLLTLFVALLRQRLDDLGDAVAQGDADRVVQSCRTIAEPAGMLGLDRLHRQLQLLVEVPPEDRVRRADLLLAVQQCAHDTAGEILRRLSEGSRRPEGPDQIELMLRRLCAPRRRTGSARRP